MGQRNDFVYESDDDVTSPSDEAVINFDNISHQSSTFETAAKSYALEDEQNTYVL